MKEAIAVYPGTFDPFTRGHEDLVRRASILFEKVVVAVARSNSKNPIFGLDDRVDIARDAVSAFPNVEVVGFDCLLMEFLKQQDARVIIRSLRAVSDFEYEFQMAGMNHRMCKEVETVFLMASDRHQFISSRFVKEIAVLGGDISTFVSERIVKSLDKRFSENGGRKKISPEVRD